MSAGGGTARVAAIIPARMGSSRFPGKPLLEVRGLTMVEHVRRRAVLSRAFTAVVVATCDEAIAKVVEAHGGTVLMTSPLHEAATDRVAEAMTKIDCTHVVNVQGDEILVLPEDLARLVAAIAAAPETQAWNAIAAIDDRAALADRAIVKCVVSRSQRILFCSRDFSRVPVSAEGFEPVRMIVGILAYRRDFLERYGQFARTPLEQAESIDQSRIIEHDVALQGVTFAHGYPGINEPREVALVEAVLEHDVRQQRVLRDVLDF